MIFSLVVSLLVAVVFEVSFDGAVLEGSVAFVVKVSDVVFGGLVLDFVGAGFQSTSSTVKLYGLVRNL